MCFEEVVLISAPAADLERAQTGVDKVGRRQYPSAVVRSLPLILLVVSVCAAQQGRENPFHGSAEDIDAGRATFRIYCSPCHGIGAEGATGPDLTRGVYEGGDSDADLFDAISDGVAGTEMTGFGGRMNDNTIWRLVAYVRSVARKETAGVPGDASRGRAIYEGRGCGGCHRIKGKGGRLGPDLSRVGRTLSLARLRESVVAPGEHITKGFDKVTVVTSAGETIQGRQINIDNFSAQLMDSQEQIHSYLREEARSIESKRDSLMPSYADVLSASEIDDLLAYLVSLRGN